MQERRQFGEEVLVTRYGEGGERRCESPRFTERLSNASSFVHDLLRWRLRLSKDQNRLVQVLGALERHPNYVSVDDAALIRPDQWGERLVFLDDANSQSTLHVLFKILSKYDLVCDYRFERLVITTRDEAASWRDETGVDLLDPPPDSAWARHLDAGIGVEYFKVNTTWARARESETCKIRLHPSLLMTTEQPLEVAICVERIPFRAFLHRLLGRQAMTCKLSGDTLFVKPVAEEWWLDDRP
ncbi:MAG: hypothetical protein QGG36_11540 [Pirellulaceae bacterium]|nr:hypothetical protein [Pirellulaceae bacterium]